MTNPSDRYTQIEALLDSSACELSVSEVHGTVVGAVANHLQSGISPNLLKLIEPGADPDDEGHARLREALNDMYREATEQLLAASEDYDLLLPDENEALDVRTDGLATWARGYVLGLLYNDAFRVDQLPESGPEIARDIMQIAEVDAGMADEKEEDWALAELHEYIKVGSQLIFEFIYAARASEAPEQQM